MAMNLFFFHYLNEEQRKEILLESANCLIRLNDQLIATGCWDPWETIKILNTRTGHIINKLK